MAIPQHECQHPICLFAHDLVNKLSVIVGHCDLLREARSEDERARHLAQIRNIAKSECEKLHDHQCQLALMTRSVSSQQEDVVSEFEPSVSSLVLSDQARPAEDPPHDSTQVAHEFPQT